MDTKIISHIFASLQTLEQSARRVDELLARTPDEELESSLKAQNKIVKEMRRVANKLQFEVAKDDILAATRSLRLFYGMNHMVRSDLATAHRTLTRYIESGQQSAKAASDNRDASHSLGASHLIDPSQLH